LSKKKRNLHKEVCDKRDNFPYPHGLELTADDSYALQVSAIMEVTLGNPCTPQPLSFLKNEIEQHEYDFWWYYDCTRFN
jgi:hypothetical protein